MKIPWFTGFISLLGLAWTMTGWSSVPVAIGISILAAAFFIFGVIDISKAIRIEDINKMKHSASADQFDKNAKRIIGLVVSGCFVLTLAAMIWLSFARNELIEKDAQMETMLDELNYSRNHSYTLPDRINVIIEGRKLQRFTNTHKLMVACYIPNHQLDPLDNKKIHMSRLFDIANDDIGIEVRMGLPVMNLPESRQQVMLGYKCSATVVPKSMSLDEITTLRYVKNVGGRVFTAFGQHNTLTPIPSR